MNNPNNQKIIHALELLMTYRKTEGRSHRWEYNADQRAIDALRALNIEIISGSQAKSIVPGVGKGIAFHIDEILQNNDPSKTGITEIDSLPEEELQRIKDILNLEKFQNIPYAKARKEFDRYHPNNPYNLHGSLAER